MRVTARAAGDAGHSSVRSSGEQDTDEWRERAVCRGIEPDLFFPVGTTAEPLHQIQTVKEMCRSCPVREDCLQFALETNQENGIWGGTAEDERRRLRRAWLERRRRAVVV